MLKCCYYEVSELAQQELFHRALSRLVWSERAEKVSRFRFDKDKCLCLGAGLVAEHMLREAGADDLSLALSQHGKPYLANHDNIFFNISHDGELAVCAVSDREVGVDVQKKTAYDPKVAQRVFTESEIVFIESSKDRDETFTKLWVRKESIIKLLGVGFLCDPKKYSTIENSGKHCFSEFMTGDHYICVCSGKEQQAEFSAWSFSEK